MRTTDLDGHGAYIDDSAANQLVSALGTNQRGTPNAEQAAGNQVVMTHSAPSPTVTSNWPKGSGGPAGDECQNLAPPGPKGVRRLTPTECERLQGFPDGWTQLPEQIDGTANPKPDSHRYAQMGNAVTVNVAQWIGERIMEASA